MIQVHANGKVYFFDESSEILDLLDMKALGVQDCPGYDAAERHPREFSVPVPHGLVRARESADADNPGIFVSYIDEHGTERSTMCIEHTERTGRMTGYVWGPEDPDGDPVRTFRMDLDPDEDWRHAGKR